MASDAFRPPFAAPRAHASLAGAAAADVHALPFPDCAFDAVLCVTVLCHRSIADPAVAVAELARVTRKAASSCSWSPACGGCDGPTTG